MFAHPIGVQLFNRPEYAEKLLKSLEMQTLLPNPKSLFIYIDGFTGSENAIKQRRDRTQEVEKVANSIFPGAKIIRHAKNLGIERIHFSLQCAVFSRRCEWAAFFEEDLVLDPSYLEELQNLINLAQNERRVVRVACTQILPTVSGLSRGWSGFYPGRGTQAVAERKDFFTARKSKTRDFLRVVESPSLSSDQRMDSDKSARMLMDGLPLPFLQHDSFIEQLTHSSGFLHVVTKPTLAEDIGLQGTHSYITPKIIIPENQGSMSVGITQQRKSFSKSINLIESEMTDYLASKYKSLFEGFYISQSRRKMLEEIYRSTKVEIISKYKKLIAPW